MHAIVSLLPQPIYREVEEIWDQLERDFGLQGVSPARFPHFSWQGAQDYDQSALEKTLSRFAAQIHPFKVRTTGLGVFSGVQPVLFIPVVKTLQLADFHRQIWQDLESDGSGINPYYCPDNWITAYLIGAHRPDCCNHWTSNKDFGNEDFQLGI